MTADRYARLRECVEKAVEAAARAICCPNGCLHARENGIFCSRECYQRPAQAAIAAFLDAVKDAPTEMLSDVEMAVLVKRYPNERNMVSEPKLRGELFVAIKTWCLALRRGVAGDEKSPLPG